MRGEASYVFIRCRECGNDVNAQTEAFVVTAAKDAFCSPCYYNVGWQNLKKPFENWSGSRIVKLKQLK